MILIVVKWKVKPEHADAWPELTKAFTEATKAEPGNVFFEWSRNLDDPTQYTLVEGFDDDAAGAHVNSEHFKAAQAELPQYVVETPLIRNWQDQPAEWDRLGEFTVE
jgi:quinol monooxygenase YgiN